MEDDQLAANPREIQIRELKDTISQLNTTIKVLTETIEQGQKREAVMQEQIDYLTKKLFGRSSEKHITQVEGQMSIYDLFDEAEKEAVGEGGSEGELSASAMIGACEGLTLV